MIRGTILSMHQNRRVRLAAATVFMLTLFLAAFSPVGAETDESISGGGYHTCVLRPNGTVACWGDNTRAQSTPPAGTFTQVSAGANHTCGVKTV